MRRLGPQTPRDITQKQGKNTKLFDITPEYNKLNLCNIHSHKNIEHRGPSLVCPVVRVSLEDRNIIWLQT